MAKKFRQRKQPPKKKSRRATSSSATSASTASQRKPASSGQQGFINPYNFVRWASPDICQDVPRTHEKFAGLSGRIVVELTTITPLCIPDPEGTDILCMISDQPRFDKPFLRVDGKPYIPGAALKGMLRSVAEAVSNSCYLVFTDDIAVFRDNRSFAVNYRRLGRLKKLDDNTWIIQDVHPDGGVPPPQPRNPVAIWKARKNLYETKRNQLFPDNPNCQKPARANVSNQFQQGNQFFPWYNFLRGMFGDTERRDYDENGNPLVIRKGGRVRREGKPVIILWPVAEQRTTPQYKLEPNVCNLYNRMIDSKAFRTFHDKDISLSKWQEEYLAANDNELFWYRRFGNAQDVCEFGRNFRYKWAYDPKQALPAPLHPCTEPHHLCPCCALFGMVEQRDDEASQREAQVKALASKVAIGPARWSDGSCDFKIVDDHKILGSPKFSCRSFYLEPSDSFDVSEDEFVSINANGEIVPNFLRGRKFYWHHTKLWTDRRNMNYIERLPYNGRRPDETAQNARIEVLLPEAKFEFTIEFENLSDWELGLLLWTIELPDVPEGAHHLGLGKPIGLGTVTLKIKQIEMIDRNWRYSELFATGMEKYEMQDINLNYVEAFRQQMTDWNNGTDFQQLPNVNDLKVILSRQQPACAQLPDVPISYPLGDDPGKQSGKRTAGNVHPSELHYKWFCEIMRWEEPLVTIQQISQGKYQNRR